MFDKGSYVVYKRDVCLVEEIKKQYFNGEDYYILRPIDDCSLKIQIPFKNKEIRTLIDRQEVEKIISNIPNIEPLDCNDKMLEGEYKKLLYSDSFENLIKIIKTTYIRNQKRIENQKKVSEKDSNYLEKAEKYLYNEFMIVLNLSYEETKKYVINKVCSLV